MRNMITDDKQNLVIFRNGIEIDLSLPKHINIDKELKRIREEEKQKASKNSSLELSESGQSFLATEEDEGSTLVPADWGEVYEGLKKGENYEEFLGMDIRKINILMGEKMRTRIFEPDSVPPHWRERALNPVNMPDDDSEIPSKIKNIGALKRFLGWLSRFPREEKMYSLDVLQFFSEIKGIVKSSPEANRYIDRTRGYIEAIANADAAGQTALKERLLGGLIMNKYESALYAVGKYYVVEEAQVIEFARRCEKGLSLSYLKNYIRPIPTEVIAEINTMNEMEIFDNYVVLHYDPGRKSFEETFREKEKRRDPILFGVIKGSRKLYYVADWTDDYCDLTLDKFAEVLQKSKESFKMSDKIDL